MDKHNTPSPPAPLPEGEGSEYYKLDENTEQAIKKAAKELRQKETDGESLLWHILRNRRFHGLKFRRQHKIGPFIVDFFCYKLNFIIELDGSVHNRLDQKARDRAREESLLSAGYSILHITNAEFFLDRSSALEKIESFVKQHINSPLSLREEGAGVRGGIQRCSSFL